MKFLTTPLSPRHRARKRFLMICGLQGWGVPFCRQEPRWLGLCLSGHAMIRAGLDAKNLQEVLEHETVFPHRAGGAGGSLRAVRLLSGQRLADAYCQARCLIVSPGPGR